jgi:hypothetical protein
MVRRAVALQEGRRARRPVILREGPPQRDKRRITDLVFGVLGLLILLGAVVLVNVLPHDEPLPDQFEVRFETLASDDPTVVTFTAAEGDTVAHPFTYDGVYLYRVEVAFEWTDNVAASDPDRFAVRLVGPDGAVARGPDEIENPFPASDGNPVAPAYTARPVARVMSFDLATRPSPHILTAQPGETAADVTARAEAAARTNGTGEWRLEATLLEAGDCPDATELDLNRAVACEVATAGQPDTGNPFQVVRVSFIEYTPVVTLLE